MEDVRTEGDAAPVATPQGDGDPTPPGGTPVSDQGDPGDETGN